MRPREVALRPLVENDIGLLVRFATDETFSAGVERATLARYSPTSRGAVAYRDFWGEIADLLWGRAAGSACFVSR